MENEKDLLLALIFRVFITTSRLVSTSIALHAPLILKKCQFLLEKLLCNWLLGNRESPIFSTCFSSFYHNFTSCINVNSFAYIINFENLFIWKFRKYSAVGCAIGSWELEQYLLLALVFHVFITTSRLVSTSIALHAQLILKKCPFLLEKNMENKYK